MSDFPEPTWWNGDDDRDWGDPPCPECGRQGSDCECSMCPTCKGKGTVNPLTAPTGFFCAGVADCPHCDGTGEL